MTTRRMPEKVRGLSIERTGADLLIYNSNDDMSHHLTDIEAEVFEACNGVRWSSRAEHGLLRRELLGLSAG